MQLNLLQKEFYEAVINGDIDKTSTMVDEFMGISAIERISVYQNNYTGNLSDILADTFSAVQKIVGQEFFKKLANDFVKQNPPSNANLNLYGAEFPKFISEYKGLEQLEYLADVARLEWFINDSNLSVDDVAITGDEIARLGSNGFLDSKIKLRSSVKLLSSSYAVDRVLDFCNQDNPEGEIDFSSDRIFLLVIRIEDKARIIKLTNQEYDALHSIGAGLSIEESLGKIIEASPDFDATEFINKCLQIGIFKSIEGNK